MSVKVLMPKPTVFDYLFPGLINLRSRRFISVALLSFFTLFISFNTILRSNTFNTVIFYVLILIFLYSLNFFVCYFQKRNKNFIDHRLTEVFLLFVYTVFIRIPFAAFVVFLVYKINILAGLFSVVIWVFISQFLVSFLYFFEMNYAGFKPKFYVTSYGRDLWLHNIIKKYHPYGQTGGISSAATFIQLKFLDLFSNNFFTKYLRYFNDNKTEIDLKNSLVAAFVLTLSDFTGTMFFLIFLALFLLLPIILLYNQGYKY